MKQRKRKLEHIRIEPAKNGYITHTCYRNEPGGDKIGLPSDDEQRVHESSDSVLGHVKNVLGSQDKNSRLDQAEELYAPNTGDDAQSEAGEEETD